MTTKKQAPVSHQILIQITDTHLMADPDSTFLNINPEESFHAVMQDIGLRYPDLDALVHTGDLAQEADPMTYSRYLTFMRLQQINFFHIPGNHDDLQRFPFKQALPIPTVIDLDPWYIVLLNSAVAGQVDGWIDQDQLQCLEPILEQYQDKYVILACHHHPIDMKSYWIDQHKLKNSPEILQVIAPYKNIKAVICGHVHQDSVNVWNNIQFLSTPSTCVQFKPRQTQFTLDQEAPGYRCLHLNSDGTFSTQIHRLVGPQSSIDQAISGY
ncbi:Icc protein [Acinetobacter calcoaceticus]|uniref:Icc protein n=1 Tax=Acinetobacter calcoaceticus TaxID=471 RepID=A0A4R1Y7E8_ACICA|nr:Icc protein [Acinetobacter calcoaceticus]